MRRTLSIIGVRISQTLSPEGGLAEIPRCRLQAVIDSPPATPTVTMRRLRQNMFTLKLDVAQHLPTPGRVGNNDEFPKLVFRPPQQTTTGSTQQ